MQILLTSLKGKQLSKTTQMTTIPKVGLVSF